MSRQNHQTRVAKCLGVVGIAMFAAACYTSHSRLPLVVADDMQPKTPPGDGSFFDYDPGRVPFSNHTEGNGASSLYEHRQLSIPSIGDNNQPGNLVTASYYRSIVPGRHPLVIVLPIWGTYTYPSRKMGAYIQRKSQGRIHVLHVHGENYLLDWDELLAAPDEESFLYVWREAIEHQRVTVIDIRRLVDWAEQRDDIDTDRVGLVGFSFSAVIGGVVATQEPRLAATVLAMGGARQHLFLANSGGKRLTAIREKVEREFGWTVSELEQMYEPIMREADAASYPGRVDPRKVLLIEAGRDEVIVEESRKALWETLGRPERLRMHYNHRQAFYSITPLGLNWMRPRIWEFLKSRLLQ
jgi:hypothetical protein